MSASGPLAKIAVEDVEKLARFILFEKHVRQGVVKAEALLPYKHVELSVSRHRALTSDALWALGDDVAQKRSAGDTRKFALHGRADFSAENARNVGLEAVPDEPPLNHANIIRWPAEKSAQLSLALKLAAQCQFTPRPAG